MEGDQEGGSDDVFVSVIYLSFISWQEICLGSMGQRRHKNGDDRRGKPSVDIIAKVRF